MDNEVRSGSFPIMGTSAAKVTVRKPERGRLRPRGVSGEGASNAPLGHKGDRTASYSGTMGATLHPTAVLYKANAAEATQGQRHVVIIPSKSSLSGEFRSNKKYTTVI